MYRNIPFRLSFQARSFFCQLLSISLFGGWCLSRYRLLRITVFEGLWWFPRLRNFILVVTQ